jgi:hypothetical protein
VNWSWTDAWLLTAACMTEENPVSLRSLFAAGDAVNHALFTDEELNRGMTNLAAAGLAEWNGEAIVLSGRALGVYEQAAAGARYLDQVMENVEAALREIPLHESGVARIELPPAAISDAVTRYQQGTAPPKTRNAGG